jgi:hypothetical protein
MIIKLQPSHNKPNAEVHTGTIMLTGPREGEEEDEEAVKVNVCLFIQTQ